MWRPGTIESPLREGRDLVAAAVELGHESVHDPLGAAIRARRHALEGRG